MNQQDQIYIDSVQEQINSGMYLRLLTIGNTPMVFLDIGANIGLVSSYFAQFSKRIVAIEPSPETFGALTDLTRNMPKIECYQVALAPENAFVPFYVNDINFTASSTVNTYGKQIMVEGITLSTMLQVYKLDHVDVCKCDAEGSEGESLSYEQLFLAKDIIKCWYIETHNCPLTSWEHKLGTIVGNLARCGYSKQTINGMAITASK